jgi:uncharacterized membrane protein YGL010W
VQLQAAPLQRASMGKQTEKKRSFFDLKEQFIFYASYHNNPVNVAIHLFCIWQLGMPRIGLVWRLQFMVWRFKIHIRGEPSPSELEFSFATGLFVKNVFVHLSSWVLVIVSSNFQPVSEVEVDLAKMLIVIVMPFHQARVQCFNSLTCTTAHWGSS